MSTTSNAEHDLQAGLALARCRFEGSVTALEREVSHVLEPPRWLVSSPLVTLSIAIGVGIALGAKATRR